MASATNAIDKVAALATVTNDFDGDIRPQGGNADIGADEFTISAPPAITSLKLIGSDAVISFSTSSGWTYDVQRATNLVGGPWSTFASNIAGTGGVINVTNGVSGSLQFYRVRLAP